MKVLQCPECGSKPMSDLWVGPGRSLRQHCYSCGWDGPSRIPEQQAIITSKLISVEQFGGFNYELYDRFGHIMLYSRSYHNEEEAEASLKLDIKCGKTDKDAGPYTAVLWPSTIEVKGKVFN